MDSSMEVCEGYLYSPVCHLILPPCGVATTQCCSNSNNIGSEDTNRSFLYAVRFWSDIVPSR